MEKDLLISFCPPLPHLSVHLLINTLTGNISFAHYSPIRKRKFLTALARDLCKAAAAKSRA